MPTTHNGRIALALMALAIIAGGYASVAGAECAAWLKETAVIATALAGLFLHPPLSETPAASKETPPAEPPAQP